MSVVRMMFSPVQYSYNPSENSGLLEMGSFLILVENLYSHKDSDGGNLQKVKKIYDYFRHPRNADLTSYLIFFGPVMKVKYIYTY